MQRKTLFGRESRRIRATQAFFPLTSPPSLVSTATDRMEVDEEAVPGQAEAAVASAVTEQPLGARSSSKPSGLETAGGIEELEKTSKIIVQQVCMQEVALLSHPLHSRGWNFE